MFVLSKPLFEYLSPYLFSCLFLMASISAFFMYTQCCSRSRKRNTAHQDYDRIIRATAVLPRLFSPHQRSTDSILYMDGPEPEDRRIVNPGKGPQKPTNLLQQMDTGTERGIISIARCKKGQIVIEELPILVAWHRVELDGSVEQLQNMLNVASTIPHFQRLLDLMDDLYYGSSKPAHPASKFTCNAFRVAPLQGQSNPQDKCQRFREGLYPLISRMNHSCRPNLRGQPTGAKEHFRFALRAVCVMSEGEEVTLSYIDRGLLED